MAYRSILNDPRVDKSIRRLKAMGLKMHIEEVDPSRVMIFVDLNSFVTMVQKRITYHKNSVYLEFPYLIVEVWR